LHLGGFARLIFFLFFFAQRNCGPPLGSCFLFLTFLPQAYLT